MFVSRLSCWLHVRWHECSGLFVKALEKWGLIFLIKLTWERNRRKVSSLALLKVVLRLVYLIQFFLSGDGFADISSIKCTPVALFSKAVVDVLAVLADPISYALWGLLFGLDSLVALLNVLHNTEFTSSLSQFLEVLAFAVLSSLSILLVWFPAT